MYDQSLIDQTHWYPKLVCYDCETDKIRRYVKKPGDKLRATHEGQLEPCNAPWTLLIRAFLPDGLENYDGLGNYA